MTEQPPISDVPPTTPPAASPAPDPAPNVAAILADLQKERKARQAAEERAAALAKIEQDHGQLTERHTRYSAYIAEQNAAALQTLPEQTREQIAALSAGKSEIEVADLIRLVRGVQPQAPAAAPVPPPPIPGGVQAQPAATPQSELTPDEREWVGRSENAHLQGLEARTIRALYNKLGKKA